MTIYKLLIISFFYISAAKCQLITNVKYFENTSWVSGLNNYDSLFLKSDTIKLIKINNESAIYSPDESMNAADYFKENDFITLEFKKNKHMKLFVTKVKIWSKVITRIDYHWSFDFKKQILSLSNAKNKFVSFFPIYERKVEMKSNFAGHTSIQTVEITLVRKHL